MDTIPKILSLYSMIPDSRIYQDYSAQVPRPDKFGKMSGSREISLRVERCVSDIHKQADDMRKSLISRKAKSERSRLLRRKTELENDTEGDTFLINDELKMVNKLLKKPNVNINLTTEEWDEIIERNAKENRLKVQFISKVIAR